MRAPPAIRATPSANKSANGSRRSTAGSRQSRACAKRVIAESPGLIGCSPLRWQSTTWSGCVICCPHQHENAGELRRAARAAVQNFSNGRLRVDIKTSSSVENSQRKDKLKYKSAFFSTLLGAYYGFVHAQSMGLAGPGSPGP